GSQGIQDPAAHERGVNAAAYLNRNESGLNYQRDGQCDVAGPLRRRNNSTHEETQLIAIFLSRSKSLSIFPVPSTTQESGFSAKVTGRPVSSRIRLSRFLIKAPPPASTIPRSAMPAESSGGVRSRT